MLKGNFYWRSPYFIMQWDWLKTEIAFIEYNYGGIANWLASQNKGNNLAVSDNSQKAREIPILLYHGLISNSQWQPDGVNENAQEFRNQMFALKKDGWQTIKLEDYLAFIQGRKELPEKSLLLTFDDGRKDSYYGADPVLRTVDYTAAMFVITGRSLGPDNEKSPFHLSEIELKKMAESGRWEIDSHTQNGHNDETIGPNGEQGHFLSNKLWLEGEKRLETEEEYKKRVTDDLKGAKLDIEKKLGVKVLAFAYPYGDLGQASSNFPESKTMLDGIIRSIYPLAFVQAGNNDFIANSANRSLLAKRITIDSSIRASELVQMLDDARYKPPDYADNFTADKGWLRGWGDLRVGDGKMLVGTTNTEDSASTFLSGSSLWTNYLMSVKAEMIKGNSFELVARYQDENNYLSCDFAGDEVILSQKVQGQNKPSVETPLSSEIVAGAAFSAAIKVDSGSATCYLGEKPVVSGTVDSALDHGGIGFKTWDSQGTGSSFLVTDLKVSENL